MTKSRRKNTFGQRRSVQGRLAKTLGISFFPEHFDVLNQRQKELNIPRSILIQMLLEIERRECLLRPELIARLSPPAAPAAAE